MSLLATPSLLAQFVRKASPHHRKLHTLTSRAPLLLSRRFDLRAMSKKTVNEQIGARGAGNPFEACRKDLLDRLALVGGSAVTVSDYYKGTFSSNAKVELLLGGAMEVVRLPQSVDSEQPTMKTLYLRSFYDDLFNACLTNKYNVLLGNPGISKSVLQYVILAGLLLSPAQIPPDSALRVVKEKLKDVGVVVRQVGEDTVEIISVDTKEYLDIDVIDGRTIKYAMKTAIKHYGKDRVLYLFEPDATELSPFKFTSKTSPMPGKSLSTLSPRPVRYQEYTKQLRARVYWMPLYERDELLAIGLDIAKEKDFPKALQPLYTEEAILSRYDLYGGVIRRVLPMDAEEVGEYDELAKQALAKVEDVQHVVNLLTRPEEKDSVDISISNKLVLVSAAKLEDGSYNFKTPVSLPTPGLLLTLKQKLDALSNEEKRRWLMKAEREGSEEMKKLGTVFFESVIKDALMLGLEWMERPVAGSAMEELTPDKVSYSLVKHEPMTASPIKIGMKPDVVYTTERHHNHPFAHFVFLSDRTTLVAVQIWFGLSEAKKEITGEAYKQFMEQDHIKELMAKGGMKVKLVICCLHSRADVSQISFANQPKPSEHQSKVTYDTFEDFQTAHAPMLESVVIWKPPDDYQPKYSDGVKPKDNSVA